MNWLPEGKQAAVCFSVDDVHPATTKDGYEAGGELSQGGLGFVERLLANHPRLKATVFVTPDWRPKGLVSETALAAIPLLRDLVYHVDLHPPGHFRLDRFPAFVKYLNSLDRVDVAAHGLHHVHRGASLAVEYQRQSKARCMRSVVHGQEIFERAGLKTVRGFAPPGWNLPATLTAALTELDFSFVCSGRDIQSAVRPRAVNGMSGLKGVSIVYPQAIGGGALVHIPVNYQATSVPRRAEEIIACGGVVSIKAHIFKEGGGHQMRDGLDADYCRALSELLATLEVRYGDSLWWASLEEVATHIRNCRASRGKSDDDPVLSVKA